MLLIQILVLALICTVAAQQSSYSCDQSKCVLPDCRCADAPPPVADPPMFLLLTFDDSIQENLIQATTSLFQNRRNPNGCPATATFFAQTLYTDPFLAYQWNARGNEIGDHSITHLADPENPAAAGGVHSFNEYEGNREFFSTYGGVNRGDIKGVRFPFLNYTVDSINMITKMGFTYDSSMPASGNERTWPYTLDYGSATDCLGQLSVCGEQLDAAGLWEIPMYTFIGTDGRRHLMDPFNDPSIQDPISPEDVTESYRRAFDQHYNDRIPFGVYTHPIWMSSGITGIPDGREKLAAVAEFLDYAMSRPNVWLVSNAQLIEYMKNPVSASEVGGMPYMSCESPAGAGDTCAAATPAEQCSTPQSSFRSCFGCPTEYWSLQTPSPPRVSEARCFVPDDCKAVYWDPVACLCTCTENDCEFVDKSRVIQSQDVFEQEVAAGRVDGSGGSSGGGSTQNGGAAVIGLGFLVVVISVALQAVFSIQ
ncbi:MAG: hypothetical protein SGCHY_004790 [Lobulomycetales sp.]